MCGHSDLCLPNRWSANDQGALCLEGLKFPSLYQGAHQPGSRQHCLPPQFLLSQSLEVGPHTVRMHGLLESPLASVQPTHVVWPSRSPERCWTSAEPCGHLIFQLFLFVGRGGAYLKGCRILVPWPGMEPFPFAVETWSLNHWTTRDVPLTVYG